MRPALVGTWVSQMALGVLVLGACQTRVSRMVFAMCRRVCVCVCLSHGCNVGICNGTMVCRDMSVQPLYLALWSWMHVGGGCHEWSLRCIGARRKWSLQHVGVYGLHIDGQSLSHAIV